MGIKIHLIFFVCLFTSYQSKAQTFSILPYLSGDQYGLVNGAGKVIVSPTYDDVITFPDCSLALIRKAGLWGVVDSKGNELIKPKMRGEPSNKKTLFAGVTIQPAFRQVSMYEPDKIGRAHV